MANSKYGGEWSTGLCDCFSDVSLCCMTIFCPCVTFGRSAEIINKGHCSTLFPAVLYGCIHRRKLREEFGLKQSPCNDFFVHCCCHCCALCQEYRELRNQGFDMELGWEGNVERRPNRGVTMAPVTEGGMKR